VERGSIQRRAAHAEDPRRIEFDTTQFQIKRLCRSGLVRLRGGCLYQTYLLGTCLRGAGLHRTRLLTPGPNRQEGREQAQKNRC